MIRESTLTVHASADKSSPPVGKVTVSNSSVTDLTVYKNRGSEASHTNFTIKGTSGYAFEFDRDGRGVKEHFQWAQDNSNEVSLTKKTSSIQRLTGSITCSMYEHFPKPMWPRKSTPSQATDGNSSAHLTILHMQFTSADKITGTWTRVDSWQSCDSCLSNKLHPMSTLRMSGVSWLL